MSTRKYTHVKELLPEITALLSAGKTQREIAEHFGFDSKYVVKGLLNRQRRKQEKLAAWILSKAKGRPRKRSVPEDIVLEQANEIKSLKMQNQLFRDFLQYAERR